MIQRFAVLTLLAAAIVLVPIKLITSAQAQQSQSYYATRGAAQASCPGAQVIRQKPPRGTMVMNDPGDGSTTYGAYTCARAGGGAAGNTMGQGNTLGQGNTTGLGNTMGTGTNAIPGMPGARQNQN